MEVSMRNVALLWLLMVLPLAGQTITGTIQGSVRDTAGLPVVGAEATLLQTSTGAARTMNSDERGLFQFASLQPDEYELRVSHGGFKKLVKSGIVLSASQTLALGELTLQVGAVEESITVAAEAVAVQTSGGEHGGVITAAEVKDVLNSSRNVMSLLQLLPGVVDNQEGNKDRKDRAFNINAQGNRNDTNNYSLNGMSINAIGNNTNSVINVGQDSVAEVRVLMSNFSAEYGRMSGANVQVVTKSGTRQFHGGGSYFRRHEQFNATNFFNNRLGVSKPRYRYHTWSYNLGGPVFVPGRFNRDREKLFFFFSQEYWPSKVASALGQLTVPTEAERNGDFSKSVDLNNRAIVVRDPSTQTPLPGNIAPASRLDRNGQALLKVFPLPNFTDRAVSGGRYNYVFQMENRLPQRAETLKLDYNLNPNNLLFFNFNQYSDVQEGFYLTANWPQTPHRIAVPGRVYIARYQRIFSPTWINELNVGYSSRPELETATDEQLSPSLRANAGFTAGQLYPDANPLGLIPNATFGGVNAAANLTINGRFPRHSTLSTISIADNVTKTAGAHTIKLGLYADRFWTANPNDVRFNGTFSFNNDTNNPLNTGYAYGNAAMGVFQSYTEISARNVPELTIGNIEWFAQDNWKATRRLTLDIGMRFCWIEPVNQAQGLVSGFDPARFDAAKQPQLVTPALVGGRRVGVHPVTGETYPAVVIGAIAPGTGAIANGMVVPAQNQGYPTSLVNNRGVNFAPRFGFAFDPDGKGHTAIRGGFGMFYNRTPAINTLYNLVSQRPLAFTQYVYYGSIASLLSASGHTFPEDVIGLDRTGKVPTVMNGSLTVQRRVAASTIVSAGYVFSLGRHLMWQRDLNSIPLGATQDPRNADPSNPKVALAASFLRPWRGLNGVLYREWASSSNYHSLQTTAQRRVARMLQMGVAWTWSKAMDYNSSDADPVTTLVSPRVWNYGLATFDRTHIFKANWIWDLPGAGPKAGPAALALRGWQLSGVTSFMSGAPLGVNVTTSTGADITGTPSLSPRAVVTGNPVLPKSERTFSRNFDTSVFRLPASGTFGNAARTVIRGPGINNWNLGLFKSFRVREGMRLQFRAEAYNAFNHTQFSALDTTARFDAQGTQVNTRMGEFTAARQPRIMQFALRLSF
jgi:hypothetical protein